MRGALQHVAWYVRWQIGGSGLRTRGVALSASTRSTRGAENDRIRSPSASETGRVDVG